MHISESRIDQTRASKIYKVEQGPFGPIREY